MSSPARRRREKRKLEAREAREAREASARSGRERSKRLGRAREDVPEEPPREPRPAGTTRGLWNARGAWEVREGRHRHRIEVEWNRIVSGGGVIRVDGEVVDRWKQGPRTAGTRRRFQVGDLECEIVRGGASLWPIVLYVDGFLHEEETEEAALRRIKFDAQGKQERIPDRASCPQGRRIFRLGMLSFFLLVTGPIAWELGNRARRAYPDDEHVRGGRRFGLLSTIWAICLMVGLLVTTLIRML